MFANYPKEYCSGMVNDYTILSLPSLLFEVIKSKYQLPFISIVSNIISEIQSPLKSI